jgi:hypothetical protein
MGHITLVGREASELKTKLGAIVGGSVLNGTARAVRKVDFELSTDKKQSGRFFALSWLSRNSKHANVTQSFYGSSSDRTLKFPDL